MEKRNKEVLIPQRGDARLARPERLKRPSVWRYLGAGSLTSILELTPGSLEQPVTLCRDRSQLQRNGTRRCSSRRAQVQNGSRA